jgi:CheY-like chemotaxis protein/HPt (histidine-containing phosphotransfer) domain-containing protein
VDDGEVKLIIKVSDTGQGMTREQLDKLFDEFSRFNLKQNKFTEGTGLGMNITQKLVALMSGSIDVESTPGVGSTFTITLVQERVHAAGGDAVIGEEVSENLARFEFRAHDKITKMDISYTPMPHGSVLIVDDIESNLYVASGLMRPYGVQIETVTSGRLAIDKIKAGNKYDVIFMDHMMPEMDGIEAVRRIRELDYRDPIVALTANAVQGNAEMFLSSGFDSFISKPIDIRKLRDVLNRYVRSKHPMDEQQVAPEEQLPVSPPNRETAVEPELARLFVNDAEKAIGDIERSLASGDVKTYQIHVHAMKSALANVRQFDLAGDAHALEDAAKRGDETVINHDTPPFLDALRAVVGAFRSTAAPPTASAANCDAPLLLQIRDAAAEYDANRIVELLDGMSGDGRDKIYAMQLASDFEAIEDLCAEMLQNIPS